uniref:F-box domain-containing protein n=1 Tax=Strongyloides venezuelensis TaxID=75913 RepID=A0A0K0G319_STRVS
MDPNNSIMDFNIEDEYFEINDNTSVLPDNIMVKILSELPWEDINTVKLISRRFYGIVHQNYRRLERRKVQKFLIKYNKYRKNYPFHLEITLKNAENGSSPEIPICLGKIRNFKSIEELIDFLKMFDMRDLEQFVVPVIDNIDIFIILERLFQIGTNIKTLIIPKIEEKDFRSFRRFIRKLVSVNWFFIGHLCAPSSGARDVYSLLSLSSINNIKDFYISECNKTKILSDDFVSKLLRNYPNIQSLLFESTNIEFLKSAFKEFFTVNQPRQMESECNSCEIFLELYFCGPAEHLHNIFRNYLNELENVEEIDIQNYSYDTDVEEHDKVDEIAVFESYRDCKNCLNNRHAIRKDARLHKLGGSYEEINH